MQTKKSLSPEEAVEEYFDMLIKSRFIEMFGNPVSNSICWPTKKMIDVAPSVQFSQEPMHDSNWLLNLDAIQSNSGEILFKNIVSRDKLTGSIMSFGMGNVLYSKLRPYLNKVVVPNEPGFGTTELIPLLPNPELLNQTYFACLLRSDPFVNNISLAVAGTKMPRVSMGTFWKFDVPLPPINLQNEFATFVKQVDKSKAICKQIFQSFDHLVKSRFIEMFGSPDNNRYDLPVETLNQLTMGKLTYGIAASAIDYDGKTRYIRITDIDEDGNLNDDYKSPDEYDEKYLLNDGDILFARSGATVGKTFQYSSKYGQALYAGYLIRSIPDVNKILPKYLLYATKSAYYNKCIEKLRRGATQPNINAQQYGSLEFLVPPLDQQESFVNFVQQVDKSKFEVVQSLLKLKDSMKSSQ